METSKTGEIGKAYLDHMQMGMGMDDMVEAYLANTQKVVDVFKAADLGLKPLPRNGGVTGTVASWGYPVPEIDEATYVYQADTLLELGELVGINAEQLVRTVEEYNEHAAQGCDPLFHRGEVGTAGMPAFELKTIEQPPFYAVAMVAGCCGTIGGPRLNQNAQVMHATGEPIQGLYAMGNCAGVGGPGPSYGGEGGTLGPAFVFGVIAANHAATR